MSVPLARVHPRLSERLEFVAAATTSDAGAPARGTRRLRAGFESLGAGESLMARADLGVLARRRRRGST
jgi:hypothetical protein